MSGVIHSSHALIIIRTYLIRAILLAILNLGSAQNPHVLRVRSGSSALAVFKLSAPMTPTGIGFEYWLTRYFQSAGVSGYSVTGRFFSMLVDCEW
ncbi:hypothetical protein CFM97_14550 [Klebsiella michiganensis]|nr:hypothetical protein [Klebsiella michiganensis]